MLQRRGNLARRPARGCAHFPAASLIVLGTGAAAAGDTQQSPGLPGLGSRSRPHSRSLRCAPPPSAQLPLRPPACLPAPPRPTPGLCARLSRPEPAYEGGAPSGEVLLCPLPWPWPCCPVMSGAQRVSLFPALRLSGESGFPQGDCTPGIAVAAGAGQSWRLFGTRVTWPVPPAPSPLPPSGPLGACWRPGCRNGTELRMAGRRSSGAWPC